MVKYSVLTYIIGDYEVVHEIKEKSENAEYILVTDNPNIKSETWNVVLDESLSGTVWERCYHIRFNPFEYCHTDICLRIDGSVGIESSLDSIIQMFEDGKYDMSFMVHPGRNTMIEEYNAWVVTRGYPVEQANKCLSFMSSMGYNVRDYKNLQQMNFEICRNNKMAHDFHDLTLTNLKYLGDETSKIERVDQTISSYILDRYFRGHNFMWVDQRLMHSKYFVWYTHGSMTPFAPIDVNKMTKPYAFNKRVQTVTKELLEK